MFKVGDKVLCKKDLFQRRSSSNIIFEKGNWYFLEKTEDIKDDDEFQIEGENGNYCNFHTIHSGVNYYKFEEYFLTVKELRRIKIKSLNGYGG